MIANTALARCKLFVINKAPFYKLDIFVIRRHFLIAYLLLNDIIINKLSIRDLSVV